MEEEGHSEICVECNKHSPVSHGTLISAKYGWRIHRQLDARGQLVIEWRCPECYAKSKGGRGTTPIPQRSEGSNRLRTGEHSIAVLPSRPSSDGKK